MTNINPSQDSNNVQCEQNISFYNIQSHQNETIFGEHIEQHNTTRELQNSNHTNINDKNLEERTTHANVVPVITNAKSLSKEDLEKIYDVIAHYSFVTFLNPNNAFPKSKTIINKLCDFIAKIKNFFPKNNNNNPEYHTTISGIKINNATGTPNLSNEEKELLINDEEAFLTQKIKEVCKDATLVFIPKSLYQLSIYSDYLEFLLNTAKIFLEPIRNAQQNITDEKPTDLTVDLLGSAHHFSKEFGNAMDKSSFGIQCKNTTTVFMPESKNFKKKTLPEISRNYNISQSVQNQFWTFNKTLTDLIKTKQNWSNEGCLTINGLKNMIDVLSERIAIVYLELEDTKWHNKQTNKTDKMCIKTPFSIMKDYRTTTKTFEPKDLNFIKALIESEYRAPKDTYRIYRGEDPNHSFINYNVANSSVSCSDGMFAGAVLDGRDGSAYVMSKSQAYNNTKGMTYIDIPKQHLMSDPEQQYFFIPPVLSIGAAMGLGEYHHIRGKKLEGQNNEQHSGFNGEDPEAKIETAPWNYIADESVFDNFKKNSDIKTTAIDGTKELYGNDNKERTVTAISFPKGL